LTRLGLAIGVPMLCAWSVYEALVLHESTILRAVPDRATNPSALTALAEGFATRTMNGWLNPIAATLIVALGCYLVAWVGEGFNAPVKRAERLRTRRLVMRRLHPDDTRALHAIMSDPVALRYWDTPPHASPAETEAWLDKWRSEPPEVNDDFIIERNGRVIGFLGSKRLPWLGFLLASGEWRRGYAGEALAAYRTYIRDRGLNTLWAVTDLRNMAARTLLERGGFREYARGPLTHEATGETIDAIWFTTGTAVFDPA
jgi:RimJ/RimL family protein N-acetyltransferase